MIRQSNKESIWGKGDALTLAILDKLNFGGVWLDLAAGDGRYVPGLLQKVDKLVVSDNDRKALTKLIRSVPKERNSMIQTKAFDLSKKFPFDDKCFDGIFCTGTLHLFSKRILHSIFSEIDRILKPNGMVIIDFPTDIKRYFKNERPRLFKGKLKYKLKPTVLFLKNEFKAYNVKMCKSTFTDDLTKIPKHGYRTWGKFVLLVAHRKP